MNLRIFLILLLVTPKLWASDLVPYLDGKLYGFANLKGEVVIPAQFDRVNFFGNEIFTKVWKNGTTGIINDQGEFIVPYGSCTSESVLKIYTAPETKSNPLSLSNPNLFQVVNTLNQEKKLLTHLVYVRLAGAEYKILNPNSPDFWNSPSYVRQGHRFSCGPLGSVTFTNGLHVAELEKGGFHVINAKGDIVCETTNRPKVLSEKHIVYEEDANCIVLNPIDGQKDTVSGYRIVKLNTDGKYLIEKISSDCFASNLLIGIGSRRCIGLMDLDFNLVVQPEYDNLTLEIDGCYIGKKGEDYFEIDADSKNVSITEALRINRNFHSYDFEYQKNGEVRILDKAGQDMGLGPFDNVRLGGRRQIYLWNKADQAGILDSCLNSIAEYSCESLSLAKNGSYVFKRNGKYGVLDSNLVEIVPALYNKCTPSSSFIHVELAYNKKGLYSASGKQIFTAHFDKVEPFSVADEQYYNVKLNGKYAIFDSQKVQLTEYSNKEHMVSTWKLRDNTLPSKNKVFNNYGNDKELDLKNTVVRCIPATQEHIIIGKCKKGKRIGIREDGTVLRTAMHDSLEIELSHIDLDRFVVVVNDMQGVVTSSGKVIVNPQKHEIRSVRDGIIHVRQNGLHHVYTMNGTLINEEPYDRADYSFHGKIAVARKSSNGILEWGIIDSLGNEIIPLKYSRVRGTNNPLVCGIENEKPFAAVLDSAGNDIFRTHYEEIEHYIKLNNETLYIVKKGKNWGIVNQNNDIILPCIYSYIRKPNDIEYLSVQKENKQWSLVDMDGKIIFDNFQVHRSYHLDDGRLFLFGKGGVGVISNDGNTLHELKYKNSRGDAEKRSGLPIWKLNDGQKDFYMNKNNFMVYRN